MLWITYCIWLDCVRVCVCVVDCCQVAILVPWCCDDNDVDDDDAPARYASRNAKCDTFDVIIVTPTAFDGWLYASQSGIFYHWCYCMNVSANSMWYINMKRRRGAPCFGPQNHQRSRTTDTHSPGTMNWCAKRTVTLRCCIYELILIQFLHKSIVSTFVLLCAAVLLHPQHTQKKANRTTMCSPKDGNMVKHCVEHNTIVFWPGGGRGQEHIPNYTSYFLGPQRRAKLHTWARIYTIWVCVGNVRRCWN